MLSLDRLDQALRICSIRKLLRGVIRLGSLRSGIISGTVSLSEERNAQEDAYVLGAGGAVLIELAVVAI